MIPKEDVGFCRGLRVRDGKWAFGGYSYHIETGRGFITNVGIDAKGPICWMQEVDPKTVGSFTGKYDATTWAELNPEQQARIRKEDWKGIPIFQGDILEAHYDEKFPDNATRTVVCWSGELPEGEPVGWRMKQGNYIPDTLCIGDGKLNRVIGNIHENAELLEEVRT